MPRTRLIIPVLFVLTLALFLPAVRHGFIGYDDDAYLVKNRHIQQGLAPASLRWAFNVGYASNWHPLTWLTLMADWRLFGAHAGLHHLVSVVLHAGNAVLVFLLLRRLTGAPWRSAAVALLFAVHPLRVESVAWAAELKDVLSLFLGLLALWCYAGYVQHRAWWRYLLVGVFLALGLMAKPMLVTLPLLMFILDVWPARRLAPPTWRGAAWLVAEKLPLLALSAASCVITSLAQRQALAPLGKLAPAARVSNALVGYVRYLGKTVWPTNLAVFYPYQHWSPAAVAGSAALLLALTAGAVLLWRRCPAVLVGWLWFVGTLVPVIGLVQAGEQSIADRYTYLPHIGLFLAVVWGVADLAGALRLAVAVPAALVGVVGVAFGVTTSVYLAQWRDMATLFRHVDAVSPDNPVALACLGAVLEDQPGGKAQSLEYYRRAYEASGGLTHYARTYGRALGLAGKYREAEPILRQALARDPYSAEGCIDLGLLLDRTGRAPQAIYLLRQAVRYDPENATAWTDLAKSLSDIGDSPGAMRAARQAVELAPNDGSTLRTLGTVLGRSGDASGAISVLLRAIQLNPRDSDAQFDLGIACLQARRFPEAAEHLRAVLSLNPGDQEARRALGDALRGGAAPPGR